MNLTLVCVSQPWHPRVHACIYWILQSAVLQSVSKVENPSEYWPCNFWKTRYIQAFVQVDVCQVYTYLLPSYSLNILYIYVGIGNIGIGIAPDLVPASIFFITLWYEKLYKKAWKIPGRTCNFYETVGRTFITDCIPIYYLYIQSEYTICMYGAIGIVNSFISSAQSKHVVHFLQGWYWVAPKCHFINST